MPHLSLLEKYNGLNRKKKYVTIDYTRLHFDV